MKPRPRRRAACASRGASPGHRVEHARPRGVARPPPARPAAARREESAAAGRHQGGVGAPQIVQAPRARSCSRNSASCASRRARGEASPLRRRCRRARQADHAGQRARVATHPWARCRRSGHAGRAPGAQLAAQAGHRPWWRRTRSSRCAARPSRRCAAPAAQRRAHHALVDQLALVALHVAAALGERPRRKAIRSVVVLPMSTSRPSSPGGHARCGAPSPASWPGRCAPTTRRPGRPFAGANRHRRRRTACARQPRRAAPIAATPCSRCSNRSTISPVIVTAWRPARPESGQRAWARRQGTASSRSCLPQRTGHCATSTAADRPPFPKRALPSRRAAGFPSRNAWAAWATQGHPRGGLVAAQPASSGPAPSRARF